MNPSEISLSGVKQFVRLQDSFDWTGFPSEFPSYTIDQQVAQQRQCIKGPDCSDSSLKYKLLVKLGLEHHMAHCKFYTINGQPYLDFTNREIFLTAYKMSNAINGKIIYQIDDNQVPVPFLFKGSSIDQPMMDAHIVTPHVENKQIEQDSIRIYYYDQILKSYQLAVCNLSHPVLKELGTVELAVIKTFCADVYTLSDRSLTPSDK